MYIVTFEEYHKHNYSSNKWVPSSRTFKDLDEAKDFVEFLYEEVSRDSIRDIHVWRANELKYTVKAKITFEEE